MQICINYERSSFNFPSYINNSDGKEYACNAGDVVQFLGLEYPPEKGMATYSSILARIIPWTEECGSL